MYIQYIRGILMDNNQVTCYLLRQYTNCISVFGYFPMCFIKIDYKLVNCQYSDMYLNLNLSARGEKMGALRRLWLCLPVAAFGTCKTEGP